MFFINEYMVYYINLFYLFDENLQKIKNKK